MSDYSRRCWLTFPTSGHVEQPIIWQMSRNFPNVSFDIRQASVQNEIGIMAVLLSEAGAAHTERMKRYRHLGSTMSVIDEDNPGSIYIDDGGFRRTRFNGIESLAKDQELPEDV